MSDSGMIPTVDQNRMRIVGEKYSVSNAMRMFSRGFTDQEMEVLTKAAVDTCERAGLQKFCQPEDHELMNLAICTLIASSVALEWIQRR